MDILAQIKYKSCSATSKGNNYQAIIEEQSDTVIEYWDKWSWSSFHCNWQKQTFWVLLPLTSFNFRMWTIICHNHWKQSDLKLIQHQNYSYRSVWVNIFFHTNSKILPTFDSYLKKEHYYTTWYVKHLEE
mgnify:CR=1 FL=1